MSSILFGGFKSRDFCVRAKNRLPASSHMLRMLGSAITAESTLSPAVSSKGLNVIYKDEIFTRAFDFYISQRKNLKRRTRRFM